MAGWNDKYKDEIPSMFNDWKYRFPSATVRERIIGDRDAAEKFRGDANLLLYQVKNAMVPNQLGQLQGTRTYNDGTVITASSVFGQDEITITTGVAKGEPSCIIQLYDLPKEIPPMMWYNPNNPAHELFVKIDGQWIITKPNGDIEVEGVDYIKTYYSASKFGCPSCNPADFTIGKSDMFGKNPAPSYDGSHRPFKYKSETDGGTLIYDYEGIMVPHFMGYGPPPDPPVPEDPLNHVVYSLIGDAGAEILLFDSDSDGSYFIWKAYTEWVYSDLGPSWVEDLMSATGLGYLLAQAFIENEGLRLCESTPFIIKVDCCLKAEEYRTVSLWWRSNPGDDPPPCKTDEFIIVWGDHFCEVPDVISIYRLMEEALYHNAVFYTFPEYFGGCVPFEWELNGQGILVSSGNKTSATYGVPEGWGQEFVNCDPISITVTDRCGKTDTVLAKCCGFDDGGGPSISYTSLVMNGGQTQTLEVIYGCPPFQWSFTGGGSLSPFWAPYYTSVHYTAPPVNTNCLLNPTITVTDCCGNSASLNLYITTNTLVGQSALIWQNAINCGDCTLVGSDWCKQFAWTVQIWDCENAILADCTSVSCGTAFPAGYGCFNSCAAADAWFNAMYTADCWTAQCGGIHQPCGALYDLRSAYMKEQGCCPLNPFTGLPY